MFKYISSVNFITISFLLLTQMIVRSQAMDDRADDHAASIEKARNALDHANYEQAESAARAALKESKKINSYNNTIECYEVIAMILNAQGKYHEAELEILQAIKIHQAHDNTNRSSISKDVVILSAIALATGRINESKTLARDALNSGNDGTKADSHEILALIALSGNDHESVLREANSAISCIQNAKDPKISKYYDIITKTYVKTGEFFKAYIYANKSYKLRVEALGTEHFEVASSLDLLFVCKMNEKNYDESESLVLRALAIREKWYGVRHPKLDGTIANIVALYFYSNKNISLEIYLKKWLSLREEWFGPESIKVAEVLERYATALDRLGRANEADQLSDRANKIRSRSRMQKGT